jgi:hypothetical protein
MNMDFIDACNYRYFPINFDLRGQKLSRGAFHIRKREKFYVLLTATELFNNELPISVYIRVITEKPDITGKQLCTKFIEYFFSGKLSTNV